jgi:hypothetical protein
MPMFDDKASVVSFCDRTESRSTRLRPDEISPDATGRRDAVTTTSSISVIVVDANTGVVIADTSAHIGKKYRKLSILNWQAQEYQESCVIYR